MVSPVFRKTIVGSKVFDRKQKVIGIVSEIDNIKGHIYYLEIDSDGRVMSKRANITPNQTVMPDPIYPLCPKKIYKETDILLYRGDGADDYKAMVVRKHDPKTDMLTLYGFRHETTYVECHIDQVATTPDLDLFSKLMKIDLKPAMIPTLSAYRVNSVIRALGAESQSVGNIVLDLDEKIVGYFDGFTDDGKAIIVNFNKITFEEKRIWSTEGEVPSSGMVSYKNPLELFLTFTDIRNISVFTKGVIPYGTIMIAKGAKETHMAMSLGDYIYTHNDKQKISVKLCSTGKVKLHPVKDISITEAMWDKSLGKVYNTLLERKDKEYVRVTSLRRPLIDGESLYVAVGYNIVSAVEYDCIYHKVGKVIKLAEEISFDIDEYKDYVINNDLYVLKTGKEV